MKEKPRKSTRKRTVKLTTIALLAVVLFFIVKGIMLQPQINENYDIQAELEAQIEYEKQRANEVDALKEIVDSDEYIEKIAREKLGMIRKDEIVFVDITGEE